MALHDEVCHSIPGRKGGSVVTKGILVSNSMHVPGESKQCIKATTQTKFILNSHLKDNTNIR